MADDIPKLSITYSSGLIPPPELMSTLAVFYDEIWLPCPYELGVKSGKGLIDPFFDSKLTTSRFTTYASSNELFNINGLISESTISPYKYTQWKSTINGLCDEGIICTLPPLARKQVEFNKTVSKLRENPQTDVIYRENRHMISIVYEEYVLVLHNFFTDKPAPEIFISNSSDANTSRLAGFLVNFLFQYQVPQLQILNAEQILEVREYLKDTKEGFRYYINEMTDDVERRIQEHNLSDLEASQKTFERKIQPQYEEFRRKLAAKKTGFWSKIAVAGGKFLQVNAAPWTPAFWGAVLEMFGVSLDEFSKSEQENFLSNKSQAFNYIATLEDRVARISNRHK
jgi:hypothetical protein